MNRCKAAFFNHGVPFHEGDVLDYIYARGRRQAIAEMTDLYPHVIGSGNFAEHAPHLADLEVIFSAWGMPHLGPAELDRLPNLRAFFYAGGSVKALAAPFLEREITVVSAWAANAVAVAEFCLGQILLACKGYFRNVHDCRTMRRNDQHRAFQGRGVYGAEVAIIGAGQIGRKLIELLRPFAVEILVVDPYLPDAEADVLGVHKVDLPTAFSRALVVSNHLPNLPDLRGVLNGRLFASMPANATFINTGRGAEVNEAELAAVLRRRPDLLALLDVTDPEPCEPHSPLLDLPNVILTSHLAGAHNDEVVRMADCVIAEFRRWRAGEPLHHQVTADMLERMA